MPRKEESPYSEEEETEYERHIKSEEYPVCPRCEKPLKPKVILFGEPLDMEIYNQAMRVAKNSDIAIGVATSLEVFPASDILLAPAPPTKKALFNLTPTYYNRLIHYFVKGDVIETLPALVEEIKKIKR